MPKNEVLAPRMKVLKHSHDHMTLNSLQNVSRNSSYPLQHLVTKKNLLKAQISNLAFILLFQLLINLRPKIKTAIHYTILKNDSTISN